MAAPGGGGGGGGGGGVIKVGMHVNFCTVAAPGGVPGVLAPLDQAPRTTKFICTITNGGTSAVSLVTRFFIAEHRLMYVSR